MGMDTSIKQALEFCSVPSAISVVESHGQTAVLCSNGVFRSIIMSTRLYTEKLL